MGGLAVQRYVQKYGASAMVLLASVPPTGVFRTILRTALHHPLAFLKVNLFLSLYPVVSTVKLAREMLFYEALTQEKVTEYKSKLQDESYRAYIDMMTVPLRQPKNRGIPTLVLGAEKDRIFTPGQVQATARRFKVETQIFPLMGHDMMLDNGRQVVADTIDKWMNNTFVAPVRS